MSIIRSWVTSALVWGGVELVVAVLWGFGLIAFISYKIITWYNKKVNGA